MWLRNVVLCEILFVSCLVNSNNIMSDSDDHVEFSNGESSPDNVKQRLKDRSKVCLNLNLDFIFGDWFIKF